MDDEGGGGACVCELSIPVLLPSSVLDLLLQCPGSSWKNSSRAQPNVYYLVARYHMIVYRFSIDLTTFITTTTTELECSMLSLFSFLLPGTDQSLGETGCV
jgi:hypothetical protein